MLYGVECDIKDAVALYDFRARTKRELSFNKGDTLTLYERLSDDWWEGATSDDRDGLIPHKYVRIRHRLDRNFQFVKSTATCLIVISGRNCVPNGH